MKPKMLKEEAKVEAVDEEQVLQMQIQQDMVTVTDIQRYEKLMNGKPISGKSNADQKHNPVGNINHKGTLSFTKHHWLATEENTLGPMEIQFDYKTSLISLNIDLYFSCSDRKALIEDL